jgi:hypothetical protein
LTITIISHVRKRHHLLVFTGLRKSSRASQTLRGLTLGEHPIPLLERGHLLPGRSLQDKAPNLTICTCRRVLLIRVKAADLQQRSLLEKFDR